MENEQKYLSPKLDAVFQELFGRQEREELTKDFLEKILKRRIEKIDLSQTRMLGKDTPEDKMSILDVRAIIDGTENCNIEMQMVDHKSLAERMLYYWSEMYKNSIKEGESYTKLKKTISIWITNFELKQLKGLEYHTKWEIIEAEARTAGLTEALEIHIIELPKIQGKEEAQDELLDWLYFLDNPTSERTKKSMEKNKKVQDAEKELEKLSQDDRMRDIAFHQKLAQMDYQVGLEMAQEEGEARGELKGQKKGQKKGEKIGERRGERKGIIKGEKQGRENAKREIAKKMLEMQMNMQDISTATGLSEEEIKKMQEEM